MKQLLPLILIFTITAQSFALFSLEKNESAVEFFVRQVAEAHNEKDSEMLSWLLMDEVEFIWFSPEGDRLRSMIINKESYIEGGNAFWSEVQNYSYTNRLICYKALENGYSIIWVCTCLR